MTKKEWAELDEAMKSMQSLHAYLTKKAWEKRKEIVDEAEKHGINLLPLEFMVHPVEKEEVFKYLTEEHAEGEV